MSGCSGLRVLCCLTAVWVASVLLPSRLLPGGEPTPLVAAAKQCNVVLIISDDQAWTDYGFMGHRVIRTPHLDRLAERSLTFTRGYVTSSLCRPSLATLITGLYPHQHGITGNDPRLPDAKAPAMQSRTNPQFARYYETLMRRIEEHPTLPRLLGERGYVSFQSGKWWEGGYSRGGFTAGMTHGDPQRGGRHGDAGLSIGRQGLEPVYQFIRQAKAAGKPFLLWYAPMMPHTPHNPPQTVLDRYLPLAETQPLARYYAMCQWFDETCGQLLDFLEREGLRQDTLVVYLADNGWIQDPKRPNQFAPRSKRSVYEGGIRTPIMLSLPGRISPRRDEQTLASSIDIAPTVLSVCGAPVPEKLPGVNLLDPAALARREAIFGEIYSHDVADVDKPTSSLQYRWVISGWWKLIVPASGGDGARPELYDLREDPHETRDLASEKPEVVEKLRQRLDAWWPGN